MVESLGEAFDAGGRLKVRCAHHRGGLKSVKPCIGLAELSLQIMMWTIHPYALSQFAKRLKCGGCAALWPKAELVISP